MRVYGSSPLYNYVELIFRSKRLFIASIVLASGVTAAVAAARSGTYSAQALIYLTGSEEAQPNVVDSAQKGSIQYKLNLLSVSTRDPNFIKEAFKDHGLDKGMTEEQFNQFCKKARSALSFASGNNVLEINCRWPDARAAEIIKAFYSAFSRRVLDEETVTSHITTRALQTRLAEYTQKVDAIQSQVIQYKQRYFENFPRQLEYSLAQYDRLKSEVDALTAALKSAKMQRDEVQRQLDGTPQTITAVIENTQSTTVLDRLQEQRADLEAKIAEALTKLTEANPIVRRLRDQQQNLEAAIKAEEVRSGKQAAKGHPSRTREVPNPQWARLDQTRSDLEIQIQDYEGRLHDAQIAMADYKKKAYDDPKRLKEYESIVKDYGLYAGIRDNLRSRLEQAQMMEKQEREMHLAEMKMIVEPESELDMVGGKSLLFYGAGPVLGLIIAFAFSLLAETLDHSLRTPIEVEKFLGKPVLAVLPRMEAPRDARRRLPGGGEAAQPTLPSG